MKPICPRCNKPAVIVYKQSGMCSVCETNRDRISRLKGGK
jgi:hypothetical protein